MLWIRPRMAREGGFKNACPEGVPQSQRAVEATSASPASTKTSVAGQVKRLRRTVAWKSAAKGQGRASEDEEVGHAVPWPLQVLCKTTSHTARPPRWSSSWY